MDRSRGQQPNSNNSLFVLSNGIGLATLGYVGLSALLAFVWEGWAADKSAALQAAVSLGRYVVSLLLPFGLMGWALREKIPQLGRTQPIRDKGFLPAAMAAGLGTACLGNLLAWLMQLTAAREGVELVSAAAPRGEDFLTQLIIFVGYSLLAATVEEVVFRGVVLRVLRPWGDLWAIWCSAALFALCHASPLQFLPALLTGGLLGILAVMTGGIGLSVVVHTCYNALALVLNRLLVGESSTLPVLVIWAVLMAAGAVAAPRLLKLWNRCRILWGRPRKDFYYAPMMLIAVAFLVFRVIGGIKI